MYILVGGAVVTGILNWLMVPSLGIAGGALATSVACFLMMVPCVYMVFRLTGTKAPTKAVIKILAASAIMGAFAYLI